MPSRFTQPSAYVTAAREGQQRQLHSRLPYVHKWWAKRLASTSKQLIEAALADAGPAVGEAPVIYDPFMGMGSLISAGLQLGCNVLGNDLNPIPYFALRTALTPVDPLALTSAMEELLLRVRTEEEMFWTTTTAEGEIPIRFALWGKRVECPTCTAQVALLRSRTIVAFPQRRGGIIRYAICPGCETVGPCTGETLNCEHCGEQSDPTIGIRRTQGHVQCPACDQAFLPGIAAAAQGGPVEYLLGVATSTGLGQRAFHSPGLDDLNRAAAPLPPHIPLHTPIIRGRTTQQVLAWGYRHWSNLFTPRHLRVLSSLVTAVCDEPDPDIRAWLSLTVSTSLDFLSSLCSFRGATFGTVRTASAHHILQPAWVSLENNPLGPAGWSGTLERIFRRRILPAIPAQPVLVTLPRELPASRGRCVISSGSSATIPLPAGIIDAVVTDPPYYDKIFYQDLAQMYVALAGDLGLIPDSTAAIATTMAGAVETEHEETFAERLTAVWQNTLPALRPGGVVAFSFRSSAPAAWRALAHSLHTAGLTCYRADLAYAESPISLTKHRARYPSSVDVMIFCRVLGSPLPTTTLRQATIRVRRRAKTNLRQLSDRGHILSHGDQLLSIFGEWLVESTTYRVIDGDPWETILTSISIVELSAEMKGPGGDVD